MNSQHKPLVQTKLELSPRERRLIQNKLFQSLSKLLADYPSLFHKQRVHILVNFVESTAYKLSHSKDEYNTHIRTKFSVIKTKILQQIKAVQIQNTRELENSNLPPVAREEGATEIGKDPIQLKISHMQIYLEPLERMIAKCEDQLNQGKSLSAEKLAYLTSSLSHLKSIRSILEGNSFSSPTGLSRYEFLEKMENQLISAVNRLAMYSSETPHENMITYKVKDIEENDSLDSLLQKLSLEKYRDIFVNNQIFRVNDLQVLTREDMKKLQLPVGVCDQLYTYVNQTCKNNLGGNVSVSCGKQVACERNELYEQMFEHFTCPITQDIMKDPVVSSDGYTVSRETVAQ